MPERLRTLLFWLHLGLGVSVGLVALTLCVTGTLLTVELPVRHLAERQLVDPPPDHPALPEVEALVEKIEAERGERPRSVTIGRDPSDPALASFSRRQLLYYDPWTGAPLGEGPTRVYDTFATITLVHRALALRGAARAVGHQIVGVSTILIVVLLLGGLLLWLPRGWSWKHLRPIVWFRRGLSGKARDYNWHNVLGIWCALPLLIMAITGVALAYGWANEALVAIAAPSPAADPAPAPTTRTSDAPELDVALALVAEASPDWQRITAYLPDGDAPLRLVADSGNGRQPQHRVTYTLDRAPLAIVHREGWSAQPGERQVEYVIRYAHSGEILGVVGQLLAALTTIAGSTLAVTGLTLSIRRLALWRRKRKRKRDRPAPASEDA